MHFDQDLPAILFPVIINKNVALIHVLLYILLNASTLCRQYEIIAVVLLTKLLIIRFYLTLIKKIGGML